jgi:hypothetical protein
LKLASSDGLQDLVWIDPLGEDDDDDEEEIKEKKIRYPYKWIPPYMMGSPVN